MTRGERMAKRTELYTPRREDLWFRREMLADPGTMSYNKGCGLCFPGYHNDTGCIDFPEENWDNWYAQWVGSEPERFYAYLRRKEDGSFLGEVNLFRKGEPGWYEMGIVLKSDFRGKGYSSEGMGLLLRQAFEEMGAAGVRNEFEPSRASAWTLHLGAGFEPAGEGDGAVVLRLPRERYLKRPSQAMDFVEMQAIQKELQAKYFDKWGGLDPRKGRDTLLWMLIEAGEAADVIKKQGDEDIMNDPGTRSHFVEELCDVMMYFNDLLLCYDITPEELAGIYRAKHRKNMKRW